MHFLRFFAIVYLSSYLAGCVALNVPQEPSPLATPITPTATIAFPTLMPTSTFTPMPTPTTAPDLASAPGSTFFSDDFSGKLKWKPLELASGGLSLSDQRLVISVRQSNSSYMAISPSDPISNAFIEVDVRPELCTANDEFGIVFRVSQDFEHYRFTLTCQGEARVVGVVNGVERVLVPNSTSTLIFPGLFLNNRLGIQMENDQFRFYINGEEVFNDRDPSLVTGQVGLIVRARQSGQTTASFDNFIIRILQPASTLPPSD